MKRLTLMLPLFALILAAPVQAEDVLAKHKCNTCHDAKAKKLGPTYKDLAAKVTEADVKNALQKGVKGKWGKAAMPPQPKAVADASALYKAIAAYK